MKYLITSLLLICPTLVFAQLEQAAGEAVPVDVVRAEQIQFDNSYVDPQEVQVIDSKKISVTDSQDVDIAQLKSEIEIAIEAKDKAIKDLETQQLIANDYINKQSEIISRDIKRLILAANDPETPSDEAKAFLYKYGINWKD